MIMGRGKFRLYLTDNETGKKMPKGIIVYDIIVKFKEGRYQYTITNINWKQPSYYGLEKWVAEVEKDYQAEIAEYLVQTDNQLNTIITKLKTTMSAKPVQKEDW